MKIGKLHMRDFGGQTVWVTTFTTAVFNPETNKYKDQFICAFKIGDEPRLYDGEYVKEDGKTKIFSDRMTALCAAFEAARKKIHGA